MRLVFLVAAVACLVVEVSGSAELMPGIADTNDDSPPVGQPDSGMRVPAGDMQAGTLIHWMAFIGDEAGVAQGINSGAGVNDPVKNGSTPLHIAAYKGHAAVARLLIAHGARVNAQTENGITPLDWAQRNGHEDVAMLLIAHGAKTTEGAQGRIGDKYLADRHQSIKAKHNPAVPPREPLRYTLLPIPGTSIVTINRPSEADGQNEKTVLGASYRIQLGAFSSKQRAMDAWNSYEKRYPEILGSRDLILDPVTAKEKNYHRVQTGPMSRSDALAICDRLKEANQTCFVMKHPSQRVPFRR